MKQLQLRQDRRRHVHGRDSASRTVRSNRSRCSFRRRIHAANTDNRLVSDKIHFRDFNVSTARKCIAKTIASCCRDEGGTYMNTRLIFDELGVDDYQFADILIVREVCTVVSRRSANLASAGRNSFRITFTSVLSSSNRLLYTSSGQAGSDCWHRRQHL